MKVESVGGAKELKCLIIFLPFLFLSSKSTMSSADELWEAFLEAERLKMPSYRDRQEPAGNSSGDNIIPGENQGVDRVVLQISVASLSFILIVIILSAVLFLLRK